ncbi:MULTISPECIES: IucA/IucC family protein [unclassified Streptomyces]|uniref:IucA/IucC family protein n=1 Tax=unclassified Streptomyces TaxID=2593676 RepID=UPI00225551F9|nr:MULTISPECIES: IucA/IucC family protein [unclassified Streptomyces]WSP57937.1 iron transporter [Streptomyces sp. NBC_01241]WSU21325.1 iron transporter [Streptomyces sp. NBC_01108]MCX4789859.1 iron transporter [Streptomyces sp. NBC_01221]MCX4794439.1 iron transporter [Streptomyces sp. NBC_01242]WSJ35788.1 iron transporter [Streptomyces sp. NBC_01321]
MNPTPAPQADGPPPTQQRGQDAYTGNLVVEHTTVPRQKAAPHDERYAPKCPNTGAAPADLLDHPDPLRAADTAGAENLLRCWVRESDLSRPAGDTLRIPLPASGTALLVPVVYWSATGWHRFGTPVLEGAPEGAPTADAVTVAALLGREADHHEGADLVARVADSVRRTAGFIAERRRTPDAPPEADFFLTAEQSLLLGHPLHPTPKSREGLSDSESRRYSPELHGSFPLHWMAVDRSVLATDSAWTDGGRPVPATELVTSHAGGVRLPDNTAPIPLHPWQARELGHRPEVIALLDAGLLHDLGPHGKHWHPTSSVRTVHQPGAEVMLKLSLGVRITNSRRENLRKELHRGVEVHRLLRSGLAAQWHAVHPGFDIVRDPAWLAVDGPDGEPVAGLDVMLRHNPFGLYDDAVCIAALTAPRPWPGRAGMCSRLVQIVLSLAAATGRAVGAVATEWFLRYLDRVVRPVLWLDAHAGVALEAHQQNTLVLLDPHGWPVGGRYRDNQGYYFRESHRAALEHRLPGIGSVSDTFVSDAVTDERFAYYLGINNVFGLIGAFGAQRLADEHVLIAAFRRFLGSATALGSPLPAHLLDNPQLRCKANLLTRLHGLDELVGPVDTQSVYVTIANPLYV